MTVARGPATATATLPRRARASRSPRTARSTADASGAPVVSDRRQAAATRASSADALRAAHCRPDRRRGLGAVARVEQAADEPVDVGARQVDAASAAAGRRRSRRAPGRAAWRRALARGTVGPSAPPRVGLSGQRTRSAPSVEVAASSMARLGVSPALERRTDAAQQVEHVVDERPRDGDAGATGGRGRPGPAATMLAGRRGPRPTKRVRPSHRGAARSPTAATRRPSPEAPISPARRQTAAPACGRPGGPAFTTPPSRRAVRARLAVDRTVMQRRRAGVADRPFTRRPPSARPVARDARSSSDSRPSRPASAGHAGAHRGA